MPCGLLRVAALMPEVAGGVVGLADDGLGIGPVGDGGAAGEAEDAVLAAIETKTLPETGSTAMPVGSAIEAWVVAGRCRW